MPPVREGGEALGNIAAAGDFQHVAPEGVGTLFGYNDRCLRLVLRPRRSASGTSATASRLGNVVATWVLVISLAAIMSALVVVDVLAMRSCVCVGVSVAVAAMGRCRDIVGVFQEVLLSSRPELIQSATVILRISQMK